MLSGVGPKVADCVLLFAFERLEAVPIDIRIRSIIEHQYAPIIKFQKTGRYSYDDLSLFCQEYFGPYAGYVSNFYLRPGIFKKLPYPEYYHITPDMRMLLLVVW